VSSHIEITKATQTDWDRVRAVRLAALADSPDSFLRSLDEESSRPQSWWVDRLSSEQATTFIHDHEHPSGIISLASYGEPPDCGIYSVWVSPAYRGAQLSDRLVTAAIAHARAEKFTRILLDVGASNRAAIRLYERHGFVPTGATSTFPPPRSHIVEIQMALSLAI
jgi:ribosomal protein S18 acetylase RimI-like enzyme